MLKRNVVSKRYAHTIVTEQGAGDLVTVPRDRLEFVGDKPPSIVFNSPNTAGGYDVEGFTVHKSHNLHTQKAE